jgi:hypothetical protein
VGEAAQHTRTERGHRQQAIDGAIAYRARVEVLRFRQFAAHAWFGQPVGDHFGGHLQVKLQAIGTLPKAKRLMLARGAPSQQNGARRQIERVAMPLEDRFAR